LRPFTDLRQATMDHIVPVSLLRTWSAGQHQMGGRPCNHAKADRLLLSVALLLCASAAAVNTCGQSVNTSVASFTVAPNGLNRGALTRTSVNAAVNTVNAGPATGVTAGVVTESAAGMTGGMTGPVTSLAVWRLLARLAHVRQSAADSAPLYSTDAAVVVGRLRADRARHWSRGDQHTCSASRPTARCAHRTDVVIPTAGKRAA
jgi:hypothetical protein